jgi:hypothetical protein
MNKRATLVIASVLVVTSVGYGSATVQQSTPVPTAAPTPQAAQKPPSIPASLAPSPAPAQPAFTNPNVRVDVTITDQTGTNPAIRKTLSLVANRTGSIRSGVNVPIPSTSFASSAQKGDMDTRPVGPYNYRTMGLSLDVSDMYTNQNTGLIHLRISLEYNPIDETEKPSVFFGTPVSYSNFSQAFTLDLENGKPIVAVVTSDPVPSRNRTLSVEVKATILK